MSNQSPINLVSIKCPDCGAALSIEEGRKQAFCTYCGARLLIENKNEYVIRKIDEAEIIKQQKEREIRLKELEEERAENKHDRFMDLFPIILLGVLILGLIILFIAIGSL